MTNNTEEEQMNQGRQNTSSDDILPNHGKRTSMGFRALKRHRGHSNLLGLTTCATPIKQGNCRADFTTQRRSPHPDTVHFQVKPQSPHPAQTWNISVSHSVNMLQSLRTYSIRSIRTIDLRGTDGTCLHVGVRIRIGVIVKLAAVTVLEL
jgi:hypothetical protein